MGPDDWLMYWLHYVPSLIVVVSTACAMLVGAWLARHYRKRIVYRTVLCLTVVSIVCWIVYFLSTSTMTCILVSLNSEDARLAESTYDDGLKKEVSTVNAAVRLVMDRHQAPNVRFYASCLIADMLATNSDASVAKVLEMVQDAPKIEPEFIGGNRLTSDFMVPGYAPPQLAVREIIQRRLDLLRRQK